MKKVTAIEKEKEKVRKMKKNAIKNTMVNAMEKEKVENMKKAMNRFAYLFNILMEMHKADYAIVPYVATIGKQFKHGKLYLAIVPIEPLFKGFAWYDSSTDNLRSFRKNMQFNKFAEKYAIKLIDTGITLDEFESLYAMRKASGMRLNKGSFFESFTAFILVNKGYAVYRPNTDIWYQSADLYVREYGLISVKYYDNTICHGVTADRLDSGLAWYEPQLNIESATVIVTQSKIDRFNKEIESIRNK